LIKGIRSGWRNNTKMVLLNYKGKWYQIDRDRVFGSLWLEKNIR
jgi:hypothetical protein